MGFLARLVGLDRGEMRLRSEVTFKYDCVADFALEEGPAVTEQDFVAHVLLHYAKMLLVVPKNYSGTVPFIRSMAAVTKASDFQVRLVLGFTAIQEQFRQGNRGLPQRENVIYRTSLFRDDKGERSIWTDIPAFGLTSQSLLSVKEVAYGISRKVSAKQNDALRVGLSLMSEAYLGGVDYRSFSNSVEIPLQALAQCCGRDQ